MLFLGDRNAPNPDFKLFIMSLSQGKKWFNFQNLQLEKLALQMKWCPKAPEDIMICCFTMFSISTFQLHFCVDLKNEAINHKMMFI